MDPERQIRFLYPPVVFVESVLWGIWVDPAYVFHTLVPKEFIGGTSSQVLTVIAGGGVVVTALGLVINTIPWAILRGVTWIFRRESHEALLQAAALERIRRVVGFHRSPDAHERLFLVATFDHSNLPNPIHRWLFRRWNAFNVNVSVAFALMLAGVLRFCLGIHVGWAPGVVAASVAAVFALMSGWAWRDTMGMLEFQAELMLEGSQRPQSHPPPRRSGRGARPRRRRR